MTTTLIILCVILVAKLLLRCAITLFSNEDEDEDGNGNGNIDMSYLEDC